MKLPKVALPLTIVAFALGFLITLQIQTNKNVDELERIEAQRTEAIKSLLTNAKEQNKALLEEHERLTKELDNAREVGGASPALIAELDRYRMMDGTVDVQGPGVVITIDDRPQGHKVVFPITTEDLLRMVNTLRFAGAEAISINGQRIISSTAIVLSGTNTKLVNQVPITKAEGVPYEILAIGNQDQLVNYFSNLEVPALKKDGITINITRSIVQIPSYKGGYDITKLNEEGNTSN